MDLRQARFQEVVPGLMNLMKTKTNECRRVLKLWNPWLLCESPTASGDKREEGSRKKSGTIKPTDFLSENLLYV